jgi:two-component system response regulator YesN
MQHLIFLRMQRASHLLSSSSDKVEVVAKAVGYSSAFHFSNVFTKWVGCRPSEHR